MDGFHVICGKLPYRFSQGDHHHPRYEGYININVCTGSRGKWKNLSPMILGPFWFREKKHHSSLSPDPGFLPDEDSAYQKIFITNFENLWQFSKIYNIDLDRNNVIQSSFFERRGKMTAEKPYRRVIPKSKGYPIASYFNGKILSYLEARIYYYCSIYASLAILRPEYQELVSKIQNGEKIHIIGYDGRYVDLVDIKTEILRTDIPFGHELVLTCLLNGIEPWKDIDVINYVISKRDLNCI
jgi:hypothetical protein